ncbi:MAG: oligosaccharide flippase family protein, partial [Chloroflexi bacterium]|nr:oligosaccharide flippase family protein [Chloroflexota bacterium]
RAESLTSPLLDLLNVKYVLTTQNIGLPGWREVYRGEISIYQNDDVLPRAFVVHRARRVGSEEEALAALRDPGFDPRREVVLEGDTHDAATGGIRDVAAAQVISYTPTQVRVRANLAEPGYLVLADAHFPGWRAWKDGEELPVLRADSIFRATPLPAGDQEVVFRYRPDSFFVGAALTGASGVVWLLGLAVVAWRRVYRDTPQTTPLQRIAKNSLTPMATQVLNRALDFGFAILMLRLLGPENAGKYAFAVLLIGFFGVIVDFGLGTLLTRDVARDPGVARRYLSNTILARGLLYATSMPVLGGVVLLYQGLFGLSDDTAATVGLFALALIPTGFAAALSATFQAHEKMEYPALVSVCTTLCKVILGTAVLLLGWGIVGLGAVALATNLFTAAMLYGLVRHALFVPALEGDLRFQRRLLAGAAPLMVNNLLSMLFFRFDVMLLQPIKGDLATGYYTTAYKFPDGLNLIPSLFTLAIFPLLSRLANQAQDSLVRAFRLALKLLLAVSLPISVGMAIIAPQLIDLVFGEAYLPSAAVLQVLIWFLPFSYVNSVTHYVLIAVNRQRFLTLAFVIGASFNILANLVVIPAYGVLGAAVVTVLSELVLMVPFFFGVSRWVGPVHLGALAWRPVLAAAVMGAVLWWLRDLGLFLLIPAGVLIYIPLALLLRVFSADDLRLLRSARPRATAPTLGG